MALTLNDKTRLTTTAEKLFIELGGGDPQKTLTRSELSEALVNSINALAEIKSPVLIKLYSSIAESGRLPPLSQLSDSD